MENYIAFQSECYIVQKKELLTYLESIMEAYFEEYHTKLSFDSKVTFKISQFWDILFLPLLKSKEIFTLNNLLNDYLKSKSDKERFIKMLNSITKVEDLIDLILMSNGIRIGKQLVEVYENQLNTIRELTTECQLLIEKIKYKEVEFEKHEWLENARYYMSRNKELIRQINSFQNFAKSKQALICCIEMLENGL